MRFIPSAAAALANEWRKSWMRQSFNPAALQMFAHGVMNWTPTDHWGYTNETGVMLKVQGGKFVVEK